jgi:hypothetical protein
VQEVTPSSATISGTRPVPATVACGARDGRVVHGTVRRRGRGLWSVRLRGLSPGTGYRCRLDVPPRGEGRAVAFRTAGLAETRLTFAAVGDSGDGSPAAATLARRIAARRPDFLAHLGDLAYPRATASAIDESASFGRTARSCARRPSFQCPGTTTSALGACTACSSAGRPSRGARAASIMRSTGGRRTSPCSRRGSSPRPPRRSGPGCTPTSSGRAAGRGRSSCCTIPCTRRGGSGRRGCGRSWGRSSDRATSVEAPADAHGARPGVCAAGTSVRRRISKRHFQIA